MRANTRPLIFLGTCLGFVETTLVILSNMTGANPTILGSFATASLGMVLLALVGMYFKEPAFLTFTGDQALSLRMIQEASRTLSPDLMEVFLRKLMERDITQGPTRKIADSAQNTDQDAIDLEAELGTMSGNSGQAGN